MILYTFSRQVDGNMALLKGSQTEPVLENRKRFLEKFYLKASNLFLVRQVHGDEISVVDEDVDIASYSPQEGDAIITDRSDVTLGILTADCLPIIIMDKRERRGIGIIHAGRVGTAKRISYKVVKKIVERFKIPVKNLSALIGPGIGKCCYEVDEKVFLPFRDSVHGPGSIAEEADAGKWMLDLAKINENHLIAAGMLEESIETTKICTSCNKDYFSYRRDKTADRMLSIVRM